MKSTTLSVLVASILITATATYAQTPAHLWSQRFGSTGSDNGYAVVADNMGNVYVTGDFTGTVDFGGGGLVSAGGSDIFIAKYTAGGAHLWSKRFGSTGGGPADVGRSLALDTSGNVYVTGDFTGTVDFGGGALVSAGANDIFVVRYTASGLHQWSKRFGGTGAEFGFSVALDGSGNVFVTGSFSGTANFGGGNLVSSGSNDVFVAKYDGNGTHLWSLGIGGASLDIGRAIATDGFGQVFVTGYFLGTMTIPGGGNLVSAGSIDVFVVKYSPNGSHLWSQRFGSTGNDGGYSVAVDGIGNAFVTGYFTNTVDFGGGGLVSAGSNEAFVVKYNPNGAHLWSQRFGSTGNDGGYSVAVDGIGNAFVTGYFTNTVDFGGGGLVSAGLGDIFAAKYNSNGAHLWSQHLGGTDDDFGLSVAVDGAGSTLLTGYFRSTADFGGGVRVSAGDTDIFVAKYASGFAEPVITSITDIGNDQGRKVKIQFARSGADDAIAAHAITNYEAYRRNAAPPAAAMEGRNPAALSTRELLADGWTYVGSAPAHNESTYGIDVPTIGDSTIALGQYYSTFFVRAATGTPSIFHDSAPDSGYSVDNLAPGIPGSLLYNSGTLSWNESPAADFDYFTVYGSNIDAFGSATVVDYSVALLMDVTASPYTYYFVTATDFSGNEGNPAKINTAAGVGGTPQSYVLSVSNFPNPFNPRTTVSYTVPSRGNVTVAIYDARGALVAMLVNNESRDAGAYRMDWNGHSDGGAAVASGIYFARIHHNDAVRSKKMVLLK